VAEDLPELAEVRSHGPDCGCTRCSGFQAGHDLSVKHGAFAALRLEPRARELADELRPLVPGSTASDEPSIRLAALALAQVEAATLYVAEQGLVDEHGNPRGILRHLGTMMNTAARLCDRLGLTPASRAALGLSNLGDPSMVVVLQETSRREGEVS
jgi:hypothetical protein